MFKKILLITTALMMCLTLFGCTTDQPDQQNSGCDINGNDCKDEVVSHNLIWDKISFAEALNYLQSNETVVLFFSFDDCPWCKEAKPYLEEVSLEYPNIKTFYVDFKREERVNGETVYDEVYKIFEPYLKEELGQDNEKMYVPYFVFLKDGQIMLTHTSTIDDSQDMDNNQASQFKALMRSGYDLISN